MRQYYKHQPLRQVGLVHNARWLPIRLFKPLVSKTSGAKEYTIAQFDINDRLSPIYRALSYTWGCELPSHDIIIDGLLFSVRQNLWEFLQTLHLDEHVWFWVDQICIDQSNTEERNDQVANMWAIYMNAHRVVSWLGVAKNESDTAMAAIAVAGPETQIITPSIATAVSELLHREYWRRLWIVQEVIFATRWAICCGESVVGWESLEKFVMYRDVNSNKDVEDSYVVRYPALISKHLLSLVKWKIHQNNRRLSLWSPSLATIGWVKDHKCYDIRDKIFGFQSCIYRHEQRIPVNYNIAVDELYHQVLALYLQIYSCREYTYREASRFAVSLASVLELEADKVRVRALITSAIEGTMDDPRELPEFRPPTRVKLSAGSKIPSLRRETASYWT